MTRAVAISLALAASPVGSRLAHAQVSEQRARTQPPAPGARTLRRPHATRVPLRGAADRTAGAPVDLTGYWVAVVSEDWAWRMHTPPKGDYASVPLNAEGTRVANTGPRRRPARASRSAPRR